MAFGSNPRAREMADGFGSSMLPSIRLSATVVIKKRLVPAFISYRVVAVDKSSLLVNTGERVEAPLTTRLATDVHGEKKPLVFGALYRREQLVTRLLGSTTHEEALEDRTWRV